jgi:RNA polymerase sigma-54 factor
MLKQSLQQKLQQKLSPQQIQLMKMIQLPVQSLEQRIKQEIEENPALEEFIGESKQENTEPDNYEDHDSDFIDAHDIDIDAYLSDDDVPSYKYQTNNYSDDNDEPRYQHAASNSFHENLLDQLNTAVSSPEIRELAEYLIGAIDEDGYIRRDLRDIVDDLAFTRNVFTDEQQLEEALEIVQQFDPAGVGARDLQECLILQLDRKHVSSSVVNAITILDECFDEFTKKHYSKIEKKTGITGKALKLAIDEITRLNPKPGGSSSGGTQSIQTVIPDFMVTIENGEVQLALNARNAPDLNISRDYKDMFKTFQERREQASKAEKEAVLFVKQKLDSAKWFIDAIRQRQETLYMTMSAIIEHQKEFFLTGDERQLHPMILKDIAEKINMDISTVSRVANSKFVQTPYGTFSLKEFFSESMKNEQGEDVSTRKIKSILEELVNKEDKRKPITDEKLAKALKEKGFPIARRTVAKYREQLGIPVARLRKEI